MYVWRKLGKAHSRAASMYPSSTMVVPQNTADEMGKAGYNQCLEDVMEMLNLTPSEIKSLKKLVKRY